MNLGNLVQRLSYSLLGGIIIFYFLTWIHQIYFILHARKERRSLFPIACVIFIYTKHRKAFELSEFDDGLYAHYPDISPVDIDDVYDTTLGRGLLMASVFGMIV